MARVAQHQRALEYPAAAQEPAWLRRRRYILGSAFVALLSLLFMLATVASLMPNDGSFGPEFPICWPNRLQMFAYCLWVMTIGWHASSLALNEDRQEGATRDLKERRLPADRVLKAAVPESTTFPPSESNLN